MKDLYKRLRLSADASDAEIRSKLPAADPDVRAAAEQVLLNPRRRPVYDRNRRLLADIGQLRTNLGLNYTRFWARREFKDFWPEFIPVGSTKVEAKRRVDPMMIANAFRSARHHGRRHAARWGGWAVAAITAGILVMAGAWWLLR